MLKQWIQMGVLFCSIYSRFAMEGNMPRPKDIKPYWDKALGIAQYGIKMQSINVINSKQLWLLYS